MCASVRLQDRIFFGKESQKVIVKTRKNSHERSTRRNYVVRGEAERGVPRVRVIRRFLFGGKTKVMGTTQK